MEYNTVIFWSLLMACLSALAVTLPRARSVGFGWATVYGVILLMTMLGRLSNLKFLHAALALWLALVLLPALIARLYQRRFFQQQYGAARRLARLISWLHPMDGWREQPHILHALELAQQGDMLVAGQILDRYRQVQSMTGITATAHFYRLANDWDGLLKWHTEHSAIFQQQPQLFAILLRAKGEVGDIQGMTELYAKEKERLRKLIPMQMRDLVRLPLFAFCGRRTEVARLFTGSLSVLPATTRDFWLATAEQAAGNIEPARLEYERLLPTADAVLKRAIQRRLERLSIPVQPLPPAVEQLLEEASQEQGQDERFGARPTLFSRQARATQVIIGLNLLMFAVEMGAGGGENLDTLYRLGAVFPPAVRAGEWWRLLSALFLHFGWLHLMMNMLALWLLGPFIELALGLRRFLLIYLATGISSMVIVFKLSSGAADQELTVGASGCIMGLVGATGAIMLRGWRREKALTAKKRLGAMILVVLTQTMFDSMVPQVSMTAHLSGVVIGFLLTLRLRDRLARPN